MHRFRFFRVDQGGLAEEMGIKVGDQIIDVNVCFFRVDQGGLAEEMGIKVGDQIIDVNGHSFENISHSDAVDFFSEQTRLVLTVRVCNLPIVYSPSVL